MKSISESSLNRILADEKNKVIEHVKAHPSRRRYLKRTKQSVQSIESQTSQSIPKRCDQDEEAHVENKRIHRWLKREFSKARAKQKMNGRVRPVTKDTPKFTTENTGSRSKRTCQNQLQPSTVQTVNPLEADSLRVWQHEEVTKTPKKDTRQIPVAEKAIQS